MVFYLELWVEYVLGYLILGLQEPLFLGRLVDFTAEQPAWLPDAAMQDLTAHMSHAETMSQVQGNGVGNGLAVSDSGVAAAGISNPDVIDPNNLLNATAAYSQENASALQVFQSLQTFHSSLIRRATYWQFLSHATIMLANAISAWSQHQLLDMLKKREVVLRLLGAEKLLANTIVLLLNGVALISEPATLNLIEFLEEIVPPTLICCTVVFVRDWSLWIGFGLAVYPVFQNFILPSVDYSGSFAAGVLLGSLILSGIGREFMIAGRLCEENFAYRLAYLVPGEVSDRAVKFMMDIVTRARNKALQYAAVGFLDRIVRYLLKWVA